MVPSPVVAAVPGRVLVYAFLMVALLVMEYERRRRAATAPEEAVPAAPGPEFRVYDRARWHGDPARRDDPAAVPDRMAARYGGAYLAWAVTRGLGDPWFLERYGKEASALRAGTLDPAGFYLETGGVLGSDLLNEEGFAFTGAYFAPPDPSAAPRYAEDFAECFPPESPSPGDGEALRRLEGILDGRLSAWRAAREG